MRKALTRKAALALVAVGFTAWIAKGDEKAGSAGPDQDGTKPALVKIAGEAQLNSHAFQYLTELSDEIGARVTGTPGAQRAIEWGVAKMKAIGLENVHLEEWQLWRGWTRGTAEVELLEPKRRKLSVDAMGWTGSTPAGGAEGELVTVNWFNFEEEIRNAERLKGKLVLIERGERKKDSQPGFVRFGEFLKAAYKARAIAVFSSQGGAKAPGMHLTHTGILGYGTDFEIPVVSLTAEDQGQIERYLASGKKVRLRVNVQNTFTNGPVESANVVGEIRGREHPEEIFVVGGHLDSWDLAEGATDNGTGVVSVLGAAEAILRSGERPRRTMRFVLFTGEEQGILGSFAYVKRHQAEMANHLGDLVMDAGQGPVTEFQLGGRDDLVETFHPLVREMAGIRKTEVNDKVEDGTDTLPFLVAGLPGINMDQDPSEYKYTLHTAADALEAINPEVLAQNTALMALAAFWIADRPARFASPWPAGRTAMMLRQKGEAEFLQVFHLWPFGDLGKGEEVRPPN